MRLLELSQSKFRNLQPLSLRPSPHATIAVGRNGQGKTNLLEAIYFLATLKPLRAQRLSELVRFGDSESLVTGRFALGGAEREISVKIAPPTRQAFVDGKKAASLEDYFGGVSVVSFTPDDLEVVKGAPDVRRSFLDRAVFNRFPAFLKESREYVRALKGRNRLLKAQERGPYLDAFDEALAKAGARVWLRRRETLQELGPRAEAAFARIGRTATAARFAYDAPKLELEAGWQAAGEDALANAFLDALAARRPRDQERGFTSVGPHADDLNIALGERGARAFASQGQQRALVLAWKVAEMENLEAVLGRLPLLLLDDVSSELDQERNAFLLDTVSKSGAQVFITTTDAATVAHAAGDDTQWYDVAQGKITPR